MCMDMAFCHLQENLEMNVVKKLMNTATKTGINAAKYFGNKYGKNLMDIVKKIGLDAAKTVSKKIVQKTAEATGNYTVNRIADKITSLNKPRNNEEEEINELEEIYIPPENRKQIIDDLRLF